MVDGGAVKGAGAAVNSHTALDGLVDMPGAVFKRSVQIYRAPTVAKGPQVS